MQDNALMRKDEIWDDPFYFLLLLPKSCIVQSSGFTQSKGEDMGQGFGAVKVQIFFIQISIIRN